jgi:plasmid stability protein
VEIQNVTLSLPKGLVQQVKVLAARRGTSISGLLTTLITDAVHSDDQYRASQELALARLAHGYDLGTRGNRAATREELHER